MEISFSPKRLVIAVATAIPFMVSAADTPSTATRARVFLVTITQINIWLNQQPKLPII